MKKTKNTPGEQRETRTESKSVRAITPADNQGWTPPERGIGGRIKEARQKPANDLSAEALSRMCKLSDHEGLGIARTTLLRYESGAILPGAREIRILCDALAVSPNWLLTGIERERDASLAEGMATLVQLVEDRLMKTDPMRWLAMRSDETRGLMLTKAKEPTKR